MGLASFIEGLKRDPDFRFTRSLEMRCDLPLEAASSAVQARCCLHCSYRGCVFSLRGRGLLGVCVAVAGVMLALTQYQSEIRIRACNDLLFDQYPMDRLDRESASQRMGYLMQMVFYFNSVYGSGFFPDQFVYEIGFT